MTEVSVRPILAADIPWLAATYRKNRLSDYASRFAPKRYISRGYVESKYHVWLAILFSRKLIGSLWLEKIRTSSRSGKLGIMIHDKKFWARGVGAYSIVKAMPIFKKKLAVSRLLLNVRSNNTRAIRCYEKIGFKTIKRIILTTSKGKFPCFTMHYK